MRSALTSLLAACIALSGCVLAEGKLIAAATGDAGPQSTRKRDAGRADANTATVAAARGGRGGHSGAGDAHDAGRSGAGGSSDNSRADDADDAGSSTTPKANGETCVASSECASSNCKMSRDGRRCYGLIAVDRACSGMYDCDGYLCVPTTADGKNGVCVDTSRCSSQNPCSQDYWAAACQLDQLCSPQSSSFNQCYQKACTRPPDTDELCLSELAVTKRLIASRCCPPAGAYHSSCDTAPQCGCKDGEKCDVRGAEGRTSCGPVGSGRELEACSTNSDCMVGYTCTESGCSRYCDGPGDRLCSPSGACKPITTQGSNAPGLFVCTRTCDPTSPETAKGPFGACSAGQRCEPAADGHSDCLASGGSGRQGARCNKSEAPDNQVCAPGFVCALETLSCAAYCKVAANDCEVGTCHSVPGRLFAFDTEIGFCAEP